MSIFKKIFFRTKRYLKNRKLFKNVLMLAGGATIAQIIGVAGSPVISRLYSPADIGVLSVYTSILSLATAVATLRFESAIPIAGDDDEAINVFALSMGSVIVFTTIVFLLTLTFSDEFTNALNAEEFKPYLWLVPVGILAVGIYKSLLYWAIRKKAYKNITKTKINQGIAKVFIQIGLGLLGFGPIGLILGHISGQSMGSSVLSKTLTNDKGFSYFEDVSLKKMKKVAVRFKKFPLISSWSGLLNSANITIPVFLLSAFYGAEVTGSFGFTNRILTLPLSIIGVAISEVYHSEGSALSKNNPKKLLSLTKKISGRLFLFGLLLTAILIPFGPRLFIFVFGSEWHDSGVYSQILSVMLLMRLAVNPIGRAMIIIERQGTQFFLDVLRIILVVAAFYISKVLDLSSFVAITNYTIAMVSVYLITYIVIIRALKKKVREFEAHNDG